jgi:hypothetical protein
MLTLPGALLAQTLEAPISVQAEVDGSFSYQAVFTAGPGGDNVFAYMVGDVQNTDVGNFFADVFCVDPLTEGEQLVLENPIGSSGFISGSLSDSAVEGIVNVNLQTTDCPGGSGLSLSADTTILPFIPTECPDIWPVDSVCTVGKGQRQSNNQSLVHCLVGNIIDPGSLARDATRIPVCAGTHVDAQVTDATGVPTNTAAGSLACDSNGCSGFVDVSEKYKSVSANGKDTDRITLLPQ